MKKTMAEQVQRLETRLIIQALKKNRTITDAARELGIKRTTLAYKIHGYKIDVKKVVDQKEATK